MDVKQPDYGNWVPLKIIYVLGILSIIMICISIVSFGKFFFLMNLPVYILWILRILALAITLIVMAFLLYMLISRYLFSYNGGAVSSKILDYVLGHLQWDGSGKLLDIGCGSGAMTVKAAKKYQRAKLVGIDYWGIEWDYGEAQCRQNASLERVDDRIDFTRGDAAALPFEDEYFDAAVSNFVFHEVKSQKDKRLVVKEALRVVKKGGAFTFHDLFLDKNLYGNIDEFVEELKNENISEIAVIKSEDEINIPRILKLPFMLGSTALIYGKK